MLLTSFATFAYMTYGAVYRLYLSPIAHMPVPRLAALTRFYMPLHTRYTPSDEVRDGIYYDLYLGG
jgi:hypothetical protein